MQDSVRFYGISSTAALCNQKEVKTELRLHQSGHTPGSALSHDVTFGRRIHSISLSGEEFL
jgi:hypothetical protein